MDIFVCTRLKLLCCVPEIKSCFLLGGSRTLFTAMKHWASRELSPRCWQDGYSSHLHVQIPIYFLIQPLMPEKGRRQCYITSDFFVWLHILYLSYKRASIFHVSLFYTTNQEKSCVTQAIYSLLWFFFNSVDTGSALVQNLLWVVISRLFLSVKHSQLH